MVLSAVTGMVVAGIETRSVCRYLSKSELRRYRALSEKCRRDFLSGRLAIKAAIHRYGSGLDGDLSQLSIENAPNGQPRLAGQPELFCSLAHSSSWGVGAVAAGPIGVDIERVRPRRPALLRLIADDEERMAAAIDRGNDAQLITRIWTMKEAVLKGMGVGLAVSPRQLRLSKAGDDAFFVDVLAPITTRFARWNVSTCAVDDFWIAVATGEESRDHPHVSWYHPLNLPAANNAAISG